MPLHTPSYSYLNDTRMCIPCLGIPHLISHCITTYLLAFTLIDHFLFSFLIFCFVYLLFLGSNKLD